MYHVPMTPCIEWTGARDKRGRGRLKRSLNGEPAKTYLAHRYFWILANGPIPEGLELMHSCDNVACINLEHLSLGTHAQNMDDMKKKGRGMSRYGRIGDKTHCDNGHRFTNETTYWAPDGYRACRTCRTEATYRYRRRKRLRHV